MALKNYKPTSPGLRQLVIVDRSELYKGAPEKSLTIGLTKSAAATISDMSQVGESAAVTNASCVLSTSNVINSIARLLSRESNMILTVRLSLP